LVTEALERLPGHRDYLSFANEIGAPLPAGAEEVTRSRVETLMSDDG
jgi:hypothetical protein